MTEIEKAVAEEREACARIIEKIAIAWSPEMSTREIVSEVQSRLAEIVRNRPSHEAFADLCEATKRGRKQRWNKLGYVHHTMAGKGGE